MGVRRRWNSWAVGRAHALVVEVPGWWATRVAVEQELARRGWPLALSPADADVLVVCGEPGERLAGAVDRVWEQLPGPRVRVAVADAGVAAALDHAGRQLSDDDHQRAEAAGRVHPPVDGDHHEHGHDEGEDDDEADEHGHDEQADHGGMDHGGTDHGGMDHGGMDHGGMDHGGMDHGGMDMAPAGIPLAGGGEDRDGLEMDVLHVPLGPVLPHWPPGLVLHCRLHGDVVTEAETEVLDGRGVSRPPVARALPVWDAAVACDGAARLLAVAGWDDGAAGARRLRDLVFSEPADHKQAVRQLHRVRSRVVQSWPLRWLLRGLGELDDEALGSHGLPPTAGGDVHDRLVAMLDRVGAMLHGQPIGPVADPGATLAALPRVVAGLELGAVRLVVASLNPDPAGAVHKEHARV